MILVGVFDKKKDPRLEAASLEELRRLAETAGAAIAGTLTQRLDRFHPGSLIGAGKVAEAAALARELGARTVIFDQDLSPAQQIHLEGEIGAKIVDRTRLILDIFAQRARTKEGELQVELAQLSYMLPRLTGSWRAFSQQVGGIGTRGPGERKLEYERRHIQRRLEHLKRAIARIEGERGIQRGRRQAVPVPATAIIGYTNAGKSTLLNRLIGSAEGKRVYADDKLFATLDATTRRVRLPDWGEAVFTDTVGFISKLPTTLIAAFRSTLEEVGQADCLIQLEDGASGDLPAQRRVVMDVLKELGALELPRVTAVNKSDLLSADEKARLTEQDPDRLFVSAADGTGIDALLGRVRHVLGHRWLIRELALHPSQSGCLGEVYRCAHVIDRSSRRGRMVFRLRVTQENWARLLNMLESKNCR
ncbi:MAG: GTPase HflX [Elusimicrobia bacterium GWA2_69_24]|nr:MAG: GTPase HflX [Elusimicrobia bacterium GWA2_69_24]